MIPGQRNAAGQLFTLPGPAPVGSPFRAGVANNNDGQVYISSGAASWTPADLFLGGEQGVWYDPSDMSTMFQDSAGTTPVTAAGQPVGLILDKSGNGNHALQTTAASRPLLQTSGGLWWLEFDGVDDALSTESVDFSATDKTSIFTGVYRSANRGVLAELSSNVASNNGSFFVFAGDRDTASGPMWTVSARGTAADAANQAVETAADYAAPMLSLLTVMNDISGDLTTLRINGVGVGTATGDKGAGNFGNYPLYFCARAASSLLFVGQIYQMIILGRLPTAQEIIDTENYIAAKSGVTLP